MMVRKVICALDTADLDEAISTTQRLSPYVGAFKVGHALTLPHGLEVVKRIQDAGGHRVFLDLKFHDIPNSVALAVCQAARYNIWMMTLHTVGGPAMMSAAVVEARNCPQETAPLLIGVSVLTSLDQHVLTDHLGVGRSLKDQMVYLSKLAIDCGMDGVVCSPHEVSALRLELGRKGMIVTPGIRPANHSLHDQKRVGTATQALADGSDYLVIGRALANSMDVPATLAELGLLETESTA